MNHSSALVFSTQLPVSVCGTGVMIMRVAAFLGSLFTYIIGSSEDLPYFQVQLPVRICLYRSRPTPFNLLFRQQAVVSLLRPHLTYHSSNGILTVSSIGISQRMILRPRLTLIRLALIRNPESFGVPVSHRDCRYLYLHLLFQPLQNTSRYAFCARLECSPTIPLAGNP